MDFKLWTTWVALMCSVNQERVVRDFDSDWTMIQLIACQKHLYQRSSCELALNQRLREGIFYILLQGATKGAGTIRTVGTSLFYNPLLCLVSKSDFQTVPGHCLVNLLNLKLNDFQQLIENNDFVETIYELRIKCLAHRRHNHLFHLLSGCIGIRLEAQHTFFLNKPGTYIGRHDDDDVLKIDCIPQRIGENAILKDLQQN